MRSLVLFEILLVEGTLILLTNSWWIIMWAEAENPVNWVTNKGQCTARAALDGFYGTYQKRR